MEMKMALAVDGRVVCVDTDVSFQLTNISCKAYGLESQDEICRVNLYGSISRNGLTLRVVDPKTGVCLGKHTSSLSDLVLETLS